MMSLVDFEFGMVGIWVGMMWRWVRLNEDRLGLGTNLGRGFWGSGLSVKGAGAVSLLWVMRKRIREG